MKHYIQNFQLIQAQPSDINTDLDRWWDSRKKGQLCLVPTSRNRTEHKPQLNSSKCSISNSNSNSRHNGQQENQSKP